MLRAARDPRVGCSHTSFGSIARVEQCLGASRIGFGLLQLDAQPLTLRLRTCAAAAAARSLCLAHRLRFRASSGAGAAG